MVTQDIPITVQSRYLLMLPLTGIITIIMDITGGDTGGEPSLLHTCQAFHIAASAQVITVIKRKNPAKAGFVFLLPAKYFDII